MPWATPDALEDSGKCRRVVMPSDIVLWEAINGALILLAEPRQWEQVGEKTPEETAAYFSQWWENYLASTEDCP